MEISQKELKDGLDTGQKWIKGTLAAWRHIPEAHERQLEGRPLGLRKYLLFGQKSAWTRENVSYSSEIFSSKISVLSCVISSFDHMSDI